MWGSSVLRESGVDSHRLDARLLLQYVMQMTHEDLLKIYGTQISEQQKKIYFDLISRRKNREPIAKITGVKSFYKYDFITNRNTLDPRPDSESLIEAALKYRPAKSCEVKNILDLGTGTGCLILSLLNEYKQARGIGLDISYEALKVASANADGLDMSSRINLICGNWAQAIDCKFDIIISNPPYISWQDKDNLPPEVYGYDPSIALFAGDNGMDDYTSILEDITRLLAKGGIIVVEAGKGQAENIIDIGKAHGLRVIDIYEDINNVARAVIFEAAIYC